MGLKVDTQWEIPGVAFLLSLLGGLGFGCRLVFLLLPLSFDITMLGALSCPGN